MAWPVPAGATLEWVSPLELRFTQAKCSPSFANNAGTLRELFFAVLSGEVAVGDVPPLLVFWYQGRRYSHDNRRLAVWRALHQQGVVRQVPVFQMRVGIFPPPSFFQHLDTRCEGEFILIRGVNLCVGLHCMFFLPSENSDTFVFSWRLHV